MPLLEALLSIKEDSEYGPLYFFSLSRKFENVYDRFILIADAIETNSSIVKDPNV